MLHRLPSSCQAPNTFQHFQAFRKPFQGKPISTQPLSETMVDGLIDPTQADLTPRQVITLFTTGVLSAFTLRWGLNRLGFWKQLSTQFPKASQAAKQVTHSESLSQGLEPRKLNILVLFNEGIQSLYRLAQHKPELLPAMLAYAGTGILGYVLGGTARGIQETAIRRAESKIRLRLVESLSQTVAQSIQRKYQSDRLLDQEVRAQLDELLQPYNLSLKTVLTAPPISPEETLNTLHTYPYSPVSRTLTSPQALQFQANSQTVLESPYPSYPWKTLFSGLILLAGMTAGGLLMGLYSLLRHGLETLHQAGKELMPALDRTVEETFTISNQEALFALGGKKRFIFGILAITAASKLFQLWFDGLREVTVTRVNAETERQTQTYNWLTLDTRLHETAEREALQQELSKLKAKLPDLIRQPERLQQQVSTLLNNIGRNSAPKYFSMLPPVGLVEARS